MSAMMEEMLQQPAALRALREFYMKPDAIPLRELRKLIPQWPPTVVFTGMASSLSAAYPAQVFLNSRGIRALVWETADLLHYHLGFLGRDILLVLVSQSGETIEITKLLACIPKNLGTVGVVNVEQSTLARDVKLMLPTKAGPESSVSTKTYNSAVAALMYLAFALAGQSPQPLHRALRRAARAQEMVVEKQERILAPVLEMFDNPDSIMVLSRGPDLSTAYEAATYFMEAVRTPAEPMSGGLFRHGALETISPERVFIVIARRWKTGRLLVKLAEFIRSNRGRVLLLSDMPYKGDGIPSIEVEPMPLGLGTLVDTVYLQFLAHNVAERRGLEPGKFWIHTGVIKVE
jgi:glucosamine--fructose-6-phosphate aminotransferase (isomerizing)